MQSRFEVSVACAREYGIPMIVAVYQLDDEKSSRGSTLVARMCLSDSVL